LFARIEDFLFAELLSFDIFWKRKMKEIYAVGVNLSLGIEVPTTCRMA
jgi:hypothetical protein